MASDKEEELEEVEDVQLVEKEEHNINEVVVAGQKVSDEDAIKDPGLK